jgi:hypothetical protein
MVEGNGMLLLLTQKYGIKSSPWFYPDSDGWFAFGSYGNYMGDTYLIKFKF